ncbi:ATP-binding protein [Methanobacterium petrolearium]
MDVTIGSSVEEVVGLSEKLIDFATANGVDEKIAMRIGMTMEEMTINTINYNPDKIDYIDITARIEDKKITMAFKDSGVEFNPANFLPEEKDSFENIAVLQKMADDISYARVIGLNSTVISIKK